MSRGISKLQERILVVLREDRLEEEAKKNFGERHYSGLRLEQIITNVFKEELVKEYHSIKGRWWHEDTPEKQAYRMAFIGSYFERRGSYGEKVPKGSKIYTFWRALKSLERRRLVKVRRSDYNRYKTRVSVDEE